MRHALALAQRGLGRTAPNPAVGCIIVSDDLVAGRGWTADGGRPHAETIALEQAGAQARGATAYVSLEPCAHHGETPPCAQALIDAQVKRVVVACEDPDERVSGRGIEMLRAAGVEVETGVCEKEALALNVGFILAKTEDRPLVTLKIATTADGKIAPGPGQQQWITGQMARRRGHLERSLHDAVLVGSGTALVDDPSLTTRLPGYEHKALRVVLDSEGRLPADSQLRKTEDEYPLLVLTKDDVDTRDLKAVLALLAERGITRLLVEGGAKIYTSFLKAGFCERLLWFKAPDTEFGAQGIDALDGYDISNIEADFGLKTQKTLNLGKDFLAIYARSP